MSYRIVPRHEFPRVTWKARSFIVCTAIEAAGDEVAGELDWRWPTPEPGEVRGLLPTLVVHDEAARMDLSGLIGELLPSPPRLNIGRQVYS